ncbi:hypothetical protein [Spirosoma sp. KUDC1026]|uniref:hypothetical protein n=1 Tax=Spirosoma sp. KUDC1026 TaxID=2745947 RepID=UPI00159BA8FD|nr:hypothetical protein [Spirosoma sp. KUDC1026]QKZ12674.1 hypothetical protein HU175_08525 [Spirosoma sp. KUDC1026]
MKRWGGSLLAGGLCWQLVGATLPEALSVAATWYAGVVLLARVGQKIAILEVIAFIAALELLLVPTITYWVFPASMPVESAEYLGYALPAYIAFYIGLTRRWSEQKLNHQGYIQAAREYLQDKSRVALVLLLIGLGGFTVKTAFPDAPTIVGALPSYCLFISVFYAYYANSPFKEVILGIVSGALLLYTVREGMFGDLFFWLMLLLLFFAAGQQTPLSPQLKSATVILVCTLLLIIQSVKGEYRRNTWGYQRGERSSNPALLGELLIDRLTQPEKIWNLPHLYLSLARFNQGRMIGSAMAKVPTHEAFASGEVLLTFLYPFVPRLLWPEKPQTGGYENIRRFTSLPQSQNTSINLSPVGEGYVNFGYSGIAFSWLYGLVLSGIFQAVFRVAERVPSAVLWLPVLFIGCLTMETDLLSTWGSLVNNLIFIALLFWLFKRVRISL